MKLVHKVSRVNAAGIPLKAYEDLRAFKPVEVKAEVNLKAKRLRMYKERFAPEISVRTSMADYRKDDWLVSLPLYAVDRIDTVMADEGNERA